MAWWFNVPGQPPSVNHIYIRVRGNWNKMAKAAGVEQYQNDALLLCRNARPAGWVADGQVRLYFRFHLKRDADCDNLLKVLQDAIARALDINDRKFLPCVLEKTTGHREPWTEIGIERL